MLKKIKYSSFFNILYLISHLQSRPVSLSFEASFSCSLSFSRFIKVNPSLLISPDAEPNRSQKCRIEFASFQGVSVLFWPGRRKVTLEAPRPPLFLSFTLSFAAKPDRGAIVSAPGPVYKSHRVKMYVSDTPSWRELLLS